MKDDVYSYVKRYHELCSFLCKSPEDYLSDKVKAHNAAMREMKLMLDEITLDRCLADKVFKLLLSCDNMYVRQSAATNCLTFDFHVEEALKVLKDVCKSEDRMSRMGAERTLKVWRGEIENSQPY